MIARLLQAAWRAYVGHIFFLDKVHILDFVIRLFIRVELMRCRCSGNERVRQLDLICAHIHALKDVIPIAILRGQIRVAGRVVTEFHLAVIEPDRLFGDSLQRFHDVVHCSLLVLAGDCGCLLSSRLSGRSVRRLVHHAVFTCVR